MTCCPPGGTGGGSQSHSGEANCQGARENGCARYLHPGTATGIEPHRVANLILSVRSHSRTPTGRGSGRLSLCQKRPTKNGSEHPGYGPLCLLTALFDLLLAGLLTLLLIGGRLLSVAIGF